MISSFNAWYDRLSGGTRFLVFMVMISIATIPLNFGIRTLNPVLACIGLTMLMFMCAVAFVRAGMIHGKAASYGIAVLAGTVAAMTLFLVFK